MKVSFVNVGHAELMAGFLPRHAAFYRDPSAFHMEPFQIADELYYVGNERVCAHLIDAGDGLVLIDSGYPCAMHLLVESIYRLGFNPRDIRWILHTHGHFDHFGASNEFQRLYGCRLAISRIDAESMVACPERALLAYGGIPYAYIPRFDRLLEDGEVFSFGNVQIACMLTPGHTPGVLSFFFDVHQDGKTYRAGLFGGVGANSMYQEYLSKVGLPLDMAQQFALSLDKAGSERVDIQLGNHPANNDTVEKRARMLTEGGNPFVARGEWPAFLQAQRERIADFIAKGY